MGAEHWIVKKPSGEEWGLIKRLIIDSTTRQITYADVIVADTGRLVRLPWENFDVQKDSITLNGGENNAGTNGAIASALKSPDTITMEVWP